MEEIKIKIHNQEIKNITEIKNIKETKNTKETKNIITSPYPSCVSEYPIDQLIHFLHR